MQRYSLFFQNAIIEFCSLIRQNCHSTPTARFFDVRRDPELAREFRAFIFTSTPASVCDTRGHAEILRCVRPRLTAAA